jgi:hypothetical protein
MPDRSLNSLVPEFRTKVFELLARCTEAGIAVMIIDTLRTQAEQDAALAGGFSWTKHSKHQDGKAIDICPYAIFDLHGPDKLNWDTSDPIWLKLGQIGEGLGLKWGGRYGQVDPKKVGKDPGHFEMP